MKKLAMALLVTAVMTLVGCGSNSSHGNINGHWTAVLTDTTFNFGTSIVVNNDGTLSVSKLQFLHELAVLCVGRDGEWIVRLHRRL